MCDLSSWRRFPFGFTLSPVCKAGLSDVEDVEEGQVLGKANVCGEKNRWDSRGRGVYESLVCLFFK